MSGFNPFFPGSSLASPPRNVVVVNEESSFPVQDATTITLEANTQYFIGDSFSTSKRFIVEDGASVSSINPFFNGLTYTGSADMFTSVGASWEISNIRITCSLGTVFNSSGPGVVLMKDTQILDCLNFGVFFGIGPVVSFVVDNSAILNMTGQGALFVGNFTLLSIIRFFCIAQSSSANIIDLGNATFDNLEFDNLDFTGILAGSTAISGLTSSGNINANKIATISNSTLNGGVIAPLNGINEQDIRYQFVDNSGVPNSRYASDMFLSGGSETVTVNTVGVFVEIGTPSTATWDSEVDDRFTVGADGVITYDGETDIDVEIIANAAIEKVGGGSNELEMRIATNWVSPDSGLEKSRSITQNNTPTSVTSTAIVKLSNGDNIRIILANNDAQINIIVESASINIIGS